MTASMIQILRFTQLSPYPFSPKRIATRIRRYLNLNDTKGFEISLTGNISQTKTRIVHSLCDSDNIDINFEIMNNHILMHLSTPHSTCNIVLGIHVDDAYDSRCGEASVSIEEGSSIIFSDSIYTFEENMCAEETRTQANVGVHEVSITEEACCMNSNFHKSIIFIASLCSCFIAFLFRF